MRKNKKKFLSLDLFSPEKMAVVKVKGLRVSLGQPVQVTAQLGYRLRGELGTAPSPELAWRDWAFIHAVPQLAKFPGGELIVTYTMVPDTNANPFEISGHQISRDGGKTWGPRSTIIMEHQPMVFVADGDNALVAIPAYLYQRTAGDEHNFRAAYTRFEEGGRRVVIEPDGVQVVDWPKEIGPAPGGNTQVGSLRGLCFDGNAIRIGGRLIASGYCRSRGESLFSCVAMVSEDNGRTWRYLATIADPSCLSSDRQGVNEGPCEISMIQLADGDLMAVFRVGNQGATSKLRRAYSHDEGRTWTKPDVLPAGSVEPRLLRIANGAILLSTGRPGIQLWLSADSRAKCWAGEIDIVEHHNRWAADASYRIGPAKGLAGLDRQTTSYTQMVEVSANRVLLAYDRSPEAAPADVKDLTRIFVLPVEVQLE